jgi:hypothetical protein
VGRRPGFSDDDLRKIVYSGHRERHAAGFYQHIAAAYPDAYGKMKLGIPVGAEDAAMLQELIGLPSTANIGKQADLYSDFDPASGTWSSPGDITEADYAKVRTLIGDFISETCRQLDEFMREHPQTDPPTEVLAGPPPRDNRHLAPDGRNTAESRNS